KVNLLYSADGITTGKEVPTTDVITNVTVKGSTAIAAGTAVTVNGTLEIDGPHTLTLGDKDLSMADNSTLKLVDGDFATLISLNGKKFVEKGYLNIEYKNGTGIPIATSEVEFYSTAKIKNVTISGANDVKMHAARTINGTLLLTNTGNLDMNGFALTLKGDVTQQKAGFVVNGGVQKSLTFAGAAAQKVTLVAAWTVPTEITFVLNKDNKADLVTIAAKNIDFTTYTEGDYRLVLTKGLLGTEANNIIILKQGIKANSSPDQGYAQTDGVITGNVQKEIYTDNANPLLGDYAIARSIVTFPVGSDAGDKRDLSLFFKNKLESTVKFTVNHDSKVPGGSNGFPIANGNLKITNYSPFFWYIKSDVALAPSYKYDLELQGQGYIDYLKDKIQNVRMVRRDSGDVANNWILQGVGTNYDNATIATDWPSVKVIDAMGGITRQGSLFAYSQCNKAPIFTAKLGDVTVTETDTVKFTYAVSDADLGQKPVMFCKELPKNATFDKTTGKFFWATTYADSGKYSVTIGATDGIDTTLATASITVLNKKRPAYFVDFLKDCSIKNDSTFTFKYTAKDEDGDAFTFALTPITDFKGTSKLENGTLTLVPSFADAGKTYNVEVKLMSNTVAVETKTAKVTVEYSRKKGDVDGNGSVQAADASEVLKAVVGLKTLDAQATYAAEVTGDGVVGALDASYILSYCVNGKFPSVAELGKMAAVSGNVTFGTFASKEGSNVVVLPVNIVEANNVMSAKLTLNVDEKLVDVENVAANMPEGWLMVHNYANGQLTVVMAGVKSMTSGNMVNVNLTMKDKEAKVAVDGKISLNDAAETMLNKVTVKQVPAQFDLSQNYPNPFNPTTNIKYQLSADSKVTINVYNMLGQLVKTLFNGQQEAGYYTINWDGTNEYGSKVTSGVYIYRLETGSYVATKKMNLLK
ncbi:MAG: FlgD immunoglobulin-like domain containing protein, partial [Ignavibacteriales bacterium]